MSLTHIGKVPRANCTTLNKSTALRSLWKVKRDTALNSPDVKLGVWTSRSRPTNPHEGTSTPLRAWLVKAREIITMAPRSQEVVTGKSEFEQGQDPPPLVCVELAPIPIE
jgi:hypothetical protein